MKTVVMLGALLCGMAAAVPQLPTAAYSSSNRRIMQGSTCTSDRMCRLPCPFDPRAGVALVGRCLQGRCMCTTPESTGALALGAHCTTTAVRGRPVIPCDAGLHCSIIDAGSVAIDRPNSGVCAPDASAKPDPGGGGGTTHGACAAAQASAPPPMPGRTIVQCDDNGDYQPVQCNGSIGLCWCVDTQTGLEQSGSRISVRNGGVLTPDTCLAGGGGH
jgi:hypothetical protein